MDSNRWLIVGLCFFALAAVPLLFTALGIGWAWRWMGEGLQKIDFNHWTSRVHTVKP